jgi:hypothetical protein
MWLIWADVTRVTPGTSHRRATQRARALDVGNGTAALIRHDLSITRTRPVIGFASPSTEPVHAGASVGSDATPIVHAPAGTHRLAAPRTVVTIFTKTGVCGETNATVEAPDVAIYRTANSRRKIAIDETGRRKIVAISRDDVTDRGSRISVAQSYAGVSRRTVGASAEVRPGASAWRTLGSAIGNRALVASTV